MNDLLISIGQRRQHLITELPASGNENAELEQMLDVLEQDLTETIAQKQANQDVIDDYRQNLQVINNWFDNLTKRTEAVDKGSGLNYQQKQAAVSDLQAEFDDQGPKRMDEIKRLAAQVIDIVNNLDSQQIEEQVSLILIIHMYSLSTANKVLYQTSLSISNAVFQLYNQYLILISELCQEIILGYTVFSFPWSF